MLIAVAAGFAAGLLVAAVAPLGHDSQARAVAVAGLGDDAAARDGGAGDSRVPAAVNGAPANFDHSERGAVDAAGAFVCTGQALIDMDPLASEEAVRQMAAGATADTQVREMSSRLDAARQALAKGSGPIVYRQASLAWRLDGYAPDRARVSIWNVGVLSRQGIAPPQASWSTSTFDLVWERDDWRIWSETVTPGPAPLLDNSSAPATSAQLTSALDGFIDFGSSR